MDESWRMRMGISGADYRRRRPSENRPPAPELELEDFDDVFGGPPKSVLARKLSADFTNAEWFYWEIFRQPESQTPATVAGRKLPEFVIPEQRREAQSWLKCKGKCMLKSKSTSSSCLSIDELSPYVPVGADDRRGVDLSSFTSRLRPINVPSRWSSSSTTRKPKKQELPPFGCSKTAYMSTHGDDCNDYRIKSFNPGFLCRASSLEAKSLRVPAIDEHDMQQLESPSSAVSSLSQAKTFGFSSDEVIDMNPWVPAVNYSEAIDINEAIAWAKENFKGCSLDQGAALRGEESNIFGERQRDC